MVTISAAVVHAPHIPSRRDDLQLLMERFPYVNVIADTGHGVTHTSRLAWYHGLATDADWHMVMEDDVLPCHSFSTILQSAMSRVPAPVAAVSLFGISKDIWRAFERDKGWILTPRVNWAQALLMPRDDLEDFLAWEYDTEHESPYWCQRVSDWAEHRALPIATTIPNLVQHAGHDRPTTGNPIRAGGQHARVSPAFWDDVRPRLDLKQHHVPWGYA